MQGFWRDSSCDRARSWASLELDGELSQIERVRLAAHLRGCSACAEVASDMRAVATLLREAPVERPARSFVPPARRRLRMPASTAFRLAAVTGITVLAGSLGVLAGTFGASRPAPAKPRSSDVALLVLPTDDASRERPRLQNHGPVHQRLYPPGRLGGV